MVKPYTAEVALTLDQPDFPDMLVIDRLSIHILSHSMKSKNRDYNLDRHLPKWTKRVLTDPVGRDPLGLSRISQSITDYLLTGIITQTKRARYYSFYCWALWHIEQEERIRNYQDFVDAFRRREAAFAMATVLNDKSTSPVGIDAVNVILNEGVAAGKYNCDYRVLPSNPLGGYGQYYSGSLYSLGLTRRNALGVDQVSEGIATDLAILFHESIKNTPYIEKKLYQLSFIYLDDLEASKQMFCLDALPNKACFAERELLRKIFFSLTSKSPNDRAILRQLTLLQILKIVSDYEDEEMALKIKDIDWQLAFPPYYYNVLTENGLFKEYKCVTHFSKCHSLWRQFCAHQFLTQAIENLLFSVLEICGSEPGGLPIPELTERLLCPEFFEVLKEATGHQCLTPQDLLKCFALKKIPSELDSLNFIESLSYLSPLSEIRILAIDSKRPSSALGKAFLLLSCLYAKWRGLRNDFGLTIVTQHAGKELWIGSVLGSLDSWFQRPSWSDVLPFLIDNLIIQQHDRVMYEKRKLDSCWLTYTEKRVVKEQDYEAKWRSSRHDNVVTILTDLGLLQIDANGIVKSRVME